MNYYNGFSLKEERSLFIIFIKLLFIKRKGILNF